MEAWQQAAFWHAQGQPHGGGMCAALQLPALAGCSRAMRITLHEALQALKRQQQGWLSIMSLASYLGHKPLLYLMGTCRFMRCSAFSRELTCPACDSGGRADNRGPVHFRTHRTRCCNQTFCGCTWPRCPACGSQMSDSDVRSLTTYEDPRDPNGTILVGTQPSVTNAAPPVDTGSHLSAEAQALQAAAMICAGCGSEDADGWAGKYSFWCTSCWHNWNATWTTDAKVDYYGCQPESLILSRQEADRLYRQHGVQEGLPLPIRYSGLDPVRVKPSYATKISVVKSCSLAVGEDFGVRACLLCMGAAEPLDPGKKRTQHGTISRSTTILSALAQVVDSATLQPRWGGYYVPKALVLRDGKGVDLEKPYILAMVHATAPFYNRRNHHEFKMALQHKILNVLRICLKHEHKVVILGAWGCGGRGAPPTDVAELFKDVLVKSEEMAGVFEEVIFAVLGDKEYSAFLTVLSP
eukprot:TRINITY_DN91197_c0_g1_i1.p1 TRINITY_DN91197_c0_g1~~TRINITY_DN91197_c0_g1_i1.p1  ORF type:complete len:467 (-),score=32.90 TRINITY_DN91197_c0_g1_i1:86-1486(-)